MRNAINKFDGDYSFLSNFEYTPISYEGKVWPTVEHLFQSAKTDNENEIEEIRLAPSPGKAKRLGRKVHLRQDWDRVKEEIMLECVRLKFNQHPHLAARLLKTRDLTLIEGNSWHDNIWGSCICEKCGFDGQNLLGKILMKVRDELKNGNRKQEK